MNSETKKPKPSWPIIFAAIFLFGIFGIHIMMTQRGALSHPFFAWTHFALVGVSLVSVFIRQPRAHIFVSIFLGFTIIRLVATVTALSFVTSFTSTQRVNQLLLLAALLGLWVAYTFGKKTRSYYRSLPLPPNVPS